MSTAASNVPAVDRPRAHSGMFMLVGIAMVLLGTAVISWACLTTVTVAATWVFGCFLVGGGIAEVITGIRARNWSGALFHLLLGVLYLIAGAFIIDSPARSAVQLTLIIAIFMIVSGLFRIVFAIAHRGEGRAWVLLNGLVTLVLGVMIYKQWPQSGLWVIGLFLGIELIMNGWGWIMISAALKKKTAEG